MKKLKSSIICLLLSTLCFNAVAQIHGSSKLDYEKPELFADLPKKIELTIAALESLLDLPSGHGVNLPLGRYITLQGIIISKSDVDDNNVKTIVIKSNNRKGATLTFTRIRKEDGSFSYSGRMLSYNHSDAFEIVFEKGQYFLTKKKSLDMINE